jgi:hypothetical protein
MMVAYVTGDSKGNARRESNPWIEDSLEKEIKRLKEEKLWKENYVPTILKRIDKNKKGKRYGSKASLKREKDFFDNLIGIKRRHYNISIRLEKLEWDNNNIIKVIDQECIYDDCDCKEINLIRFPEHYLHHSKKECSKCGRWQKFVSLYEYYEELTGVAKYS